jgi:urea transporter
VYVLPASVLGAVAGGLTSAVLRQEWGDREAALDIVFASVLMVLSMFVLAVIYHNSTTVSFSALLGVGLTVSTAGVVARHLILLKLRSSGPATSA